MAQRQSKRTLGIMSVGIPATKGNKARASEKKASATLRGKRENYFSGWREGSQEPRYRAIGRIVPKAAKGALGSTPSKKKTTKKK